jgi:hypothetical protein
VSLDANFHGHDRIVGLQRPPASTGRHGSAHLIPVPAPLQAACLSSDLTTRGASAGRQRTEQRPGYFGLPLAPKPKLSNAALVRQMRA